MSGKLWQSPLAHLVLILLAGTLVYANTFSVPFVFDDLESIVNNESIRSLGNFLPGGSGLDFHFRRWVAYFTFALNYRLGGLETAGYHAVNLAIHLATAALLYALARLTCRTPLLAASRLAPRAGVAALLAALFFLLHPVQTQAVTYTVQRLTSLCTMFYLLALVLYAWGRLLQTRGRGLGTGNIQSLATNNQQPATSYQLPAPALFAGSFLSALLAMFTKEIAFTLPFAVLLFEASFFRGPWRQRLPALAPLLLTLAIIPILVLQGGELTSEGTLAQAYQEMSRGPYLLTQFPVLVTYLRLLVLPVNQNLDYDYPLYTSFFATPVVLSFLLLIGLLALALWLFCLTRSAGNASPLTPHPSRRTADPAVRLIAFGIGWFFLTIAIEAGVVPLPDVIFEHRLYLPSLGLALAAATAVVLAGERSRGLLDGRLPLLLAGVAIITLGVATWQRNQVWQSAVSLWQDTLRKSPDKVRVLYNYGTYLADHGRPAEALPLLSRAVERDPRNADAWHNLGRALLVLGRSEEALPPLRRAVELAPAMRNALLNLTSALITSGQYHEAIALLEDKRRQEPPWVEARLNLGLAYAGSGDLAAARRELAELQRLDPRLARYLAEAIARAGR